MPHIVFEKPNNLSFPLQSDNIEFVCEAKSPYESKILIKYDNMEFLLSKKNRPSKTNPNLQILKADKPTRPSKAVVIKKTLQEFVDRYQVTPVFSNIQNLKDYTKKGSLYLKEIEYFIKGFKTDKKIFVEIGFGSGRHLLYQAKQNLDKLIIGLEIHTPSIEQVLRQIELQNIKNVLVLDYDARLFLEFLDSNSIEKIFVHFPVPWEKKPHRRVYSKEFVDEAIRVLSIDGSLELRSDSKEYFDFALSILTDLSKASIHIDINKDLQISSKYEDRWKKQGKNIYDLVLTNQIDSLNKEQLDDFSFTKHIAFKIIDKLPPKPIVKGDFFVHFRDIYIIDDSSYLLEVTFGDFNKPLTKYIFIDQNITRYIQGEPLATKANLKAHRLIDEFINND